MRGLVACLWVGLVGCLEPVASQGGAWDTGEPPDASQPDLDAGDRDEDSDGPNGPDARDAAADTQVDASPDDAGMADAVVSDAVVSDAGLPDRPSCPPQGGAIQFRAGNSVVDGYCEPDGWLLVAHSAASSTGLETFGWTVRRGSPQDRSQAYSLGVPLRFSQMRLVAEGTDGRGPKVLMVEVPDNFALDHATSTVEPVWKNANNIPCGGLPQMFSYAGHTQNTSSFWFRDSATYEPSYGLFSDGWHLNYDTCEQAGGFNNLQGAIYVRALAR